MAKGDKAKAALVAELKQKVASGADINDLLKEIESTVTKRASSKQMLANYPDEYAMAQKLQGWCVSVNRRLSISADGIKMLKPIEKKEEEEKKEE